MCAASWLVCATARGEIDVDQLDGYLRTDKKLTLSQRNFGKAFTLVY